ncbi:hypothetical protein VOLCADRAFT_96837 [Volvox carteri f. nagariensis]|uniref:Cyclin C-terminal domain-containing protein n=1 Tax=Volvox carteri f. nagariensis TaxID=3068 RepID=D8UB70_VOLCA|nr:uncharacterized protein VOLCADRAFT_96837 [Volvox carteri f. nagariensis]EFJ43119.1 hypothetical protein VOLCADRAFT_96837 [Volvox carteri f. nagariensis]|eukprot:XP_002955918.1 hypothetical protein VOLCADRAFT_96837 [Volvox carteri f. nagariensis]
MTTFPKLNSLFRFLELPVEIQVTCLGLASDTASLCTALSTCTTLLNLKEAAFKAFCHRNWPKVADVAMDALAKGVARPKTFWQHVVRTALMIQSSSAATTDPSLTFNEHMVEGRRVMLVEWLVQVSYAWSLDGAAIFFAVRIMDAFLAAVPPTSVQMLQLVGISCLRATVQGQQLLTHRMEDQAGAAPKDTCCSGFGAPRLQDSPCCSLDIHADTAAVTTAMQLTATATAIGATAATESPVADPSDPSSHQRLPSSASAAAHLCADVYSSEDVERMTGLVLECVFGRPSPGSLQTVNVGQQLSQPPVPPLPCRQCRCRTTRPVLLAAPTARHFLRGIWAADAAETALDSGTASASASTSASTSGALHLAGFLLHLSLLCPACCAAAPSHVAAAAVSLARETFGLPPWPPALRAVLPLRLDVDLDPLRERIAAAQTKYDVPYLRGAWMERLANAHWPVSERSGAAAEDQSRQGAAGPSRAEGREGVERADGGGGGGGGSEFRSIPVEVGHSKRAIGAVGAGDGNLDAAAAAAGFVDVVAAVGADVARRLVEDVVQGKVTLLPPRVRVS